MPHALRYLYIKKQCDNTKACEEHEADKEVASVEEREDDHYCVGSIYSRPYHLLSKIRELNVGLIRIDRRDI